MHFICFCLKEPVCSTYYARSKIFPFIQQFSLNLVKRRILCKCLHATLIKSCQDRLSISINVEIERSKTFITRVTYFPIFVKSSNRKLNVLAAKTAEIRERERIKVQVVIYTKTDLLNLKKNVAATHKLNVEFSSSC